MNLVDEVATAIDKFGVPSQSELEAMVKRHISEKCARKQHAGDWGAATFRGEKIEAGYVAPCVMPGCWDEALDIYKAMCPLHELAYIAKYGKPSDEVLTGAEWALMLKRREEFR